MALQFLSYKLKWVIYKRPKSFLQFNIVTDFSTGYTSPSYLLRFVRGFATWFCRRPPSRLLLADRKWIWRYNFYPINSSGSFTNDLSHFYNSISSPTSAPGTQVRRTLDFTWFRDFGDRPHACCWPTGSGNGGTISIHFINSSGSFTNDLSHFYNSISSPTSAPGTQVRRTLDFTWFAMSATALTLAAGRPEVDMALQFLSYKLKWVIYKRPKSFLQFNIVTDFSTGYTSPSYLRFYRFYLVCDVGDRPHACCWPTGSGYGGTISIL
jgi:hypothetical protein